MAEPRASGPAALFALWVVFEAAALIYGGVYDALKLYAQKARGSRGRDPEEPPRGGGDERPRACCAMPPPASCYDFCDLEEKQEKLRCGRL